MSWTVSFLLGVCLVGRDSGWLWRAGVIGSIDCVGRCWASGLAAYFTLNAVTWSYFWVISVEVLIVDGAEVFYFVIAETVNLKMNQ